MATIKVHGYEFGVESGGFGPQAGAEQARDEAVGYLYEKLSRLTTSYAHRLWEGLSGEDEEEIFRGDAQCYRSVKQATSGWRCWENGYYGDTPALTLTAV